MHKLPVPVFKISSYVRSDYAAFLSLVRLGDRLEMKREGYCHWAIFVGEQFIPVEDQVEGAPSNCNKEKKILTSKLRVSLYNF